MATLLDVQESGSEISSAPRDRKSDAESRGASDWQFLLVDTGQISGLLLWVINDTVLIRPPGVVVHRGWHGAEAAVA